MKNKIQIIEEILKEKNIKLTMQRREILKVFLSYDHHFLPEEIYDLVKEKKIGLATVYRTLEILKVHGIIEEISIGKDRYYELKLFSEKRMHIHFQCEQCGKIYDYDKTEMILDLIKLRDLTESTYHGKVNDVTVVMTGVCQQCRG